jgi:hypothetical protein
MNSVCKQFCSASASAPHNVGRLHATLSRSLLVRLQFLGPLNAEGSLIHNQAVLCCPCKQGAKRLLFYVFIYPISHGKDKTSMAEIVLFRLANTHQPLVYGTRAWLSKRVVFAPSVTVHSPSTQCAHLTPHTVGRTPRLSLAIANIAQAYTRSLPRSGSA